MSTLLLVTWLLSGSAFTSLRADILMQMEIKVFFEPSKKKPQGSVMTSKMEFKTSPEWSRMDGDMLLGGYMVINNKSSMTYTVYPQKKTYSEMNMRQMRAAMEKLSDPQVAYQMCLDSRKALAEGEKMPPCTRPTGTPNVGQTKNSVTSMGKSEIFNGYRCNWYRESSKPNDWSELCFVAFKDLKLSASDQKFLESEAWRELQQNGARRQAARLPGHWAIRSIHFEEGKKKATADILVIRSVPSFSKTEFSIPAGFKKSNSPFGF